MKLETLAVHGGYQPESAHRAVAVPIYQTTSFAFDSTEHAAEVFTLGASTDVAYTRVGNPTTAALEERVAALEGGTAALALASGMTAVSYAIQALARVGDNVIVTRGLYGSSHAYFDSLLPLSGIEARFIDPSTPDAVAQVADERTVAVFTESIGNPLGNVVDLEAFATRAHAVGAPLIVDNTVPSPALIRPLEWGADIVVHSLTKYLGGHGTSIGGAIVDGGTFPWTDHAARYPALTAPEPTHGGAVFAEAFPDFPLVTRARAVLLYSLGGAISPFNAFLILQGIETLPLRIRQISDNALAVAQYLQRHPRVAWVRYAGLPAHPDHHLLTTYSGGRSSGLISFGLDGGHDTGRAFIDALRLVTHLVNIGDTKSLACHPASTTHHQLTDEQLELAGLGQDLVRLVIGIEHIDDILEDIDRAITVATRTTTATTTTGPG